MFESENFIGYIRSEYAFTNMFVMELLENLLQFITETFDGDKERTLAAINSCLPYEITENEIADFWKE